MRIALACLLVLAAACQKEDPAERSARTVARAAAAPPALTTPVDVAKSPEPAPAPSCGGGCGEEGHSCGAQCGAGPEVRWATVPAGSTWTSMHVTGMHCGGCAKRVERALAGVTGIVGAEVDLPTGMVKVATARGVDARGLAKPAIDALGYRVD